MNRAKVIVVEDDPEIAESIKRALSGGYEVTVLTEPKEALAVILRSADVGLILSDLMMPGMTGSDLYDEVKKAKPGLEKRMVFLSGGPSTVKAMKFCKSVPNLFLEKPLTMADLKVQVGKLVAPDYSGGKS